MKVAHPIPAGRDALRAWYRLDGKHALEEELR
jgi:hypothetical protein